MAKLTPEQVAEIKDLWDVTEMTQVDLAAKYEVSQSHVSRILSGTRRQGKQSSRNRNLTDAQLQDIRLKAMTTDLSQAEIGKPYDLSQSEVSAIVTGKNYSTVPRSEDELKVLNAVSKPEVVEVS